MARRCMRGVLLLLSIFFLLSSFSRLASAAEYEIDPGHSFVEFRIQHLGYSWLYGRFNTISGKFSYDAARPEVSRITLEIDVASVDTNHAERDKHLRGKKFLDVKRYPKAAFKSTKYTGTAERGVLEGILTLHGVSRPVSIDVQRVGEGADPWGGYRVGFIGTMTLTRSDFGISRDLGPASETMEMELGIEGVRK